MWAGARRAVSARWARGLTFDELGAALLFLAFAFAAALLPAQADTFWHLRAGQDTWARHAVPLVETFSYTARGRPWPNHEWLWQAASFAMFRLAGWPGLALAGAAIVVAMLALVWSLTRGPLRRRTLLAAAVMPLPAVVWALRPQIASLLFLALTLVLFERRKTWLWPPLFVLWANVHGAVALGVVVVGVAALVSVLSEGRRAFPVVLAAALATAATLVTPLGPGLWTFIVESIGRSGEVQINEWRPLSLTEVEGMWFCALAAALVALTWRRWRTLADTPSRTLVVLAWVLAPLAWRHGRNVAPFAVVVLPALCRLWPDARTAPSVASPDHPRLNAMILAAAAVLATAGIVGSYRRPLDRLGWHPIAPAALAALRACPGNLYNRYDDGGWLTFLAPERPVFIDSRQDPYPRAFVAAHVQNEASGDFAATFARWDIACAFLPPASPTAAALLRAGWSTRYRDQRWQILERAP